MMGVTFNGSARAHLIARYPHRILSIPAVVLGYIAESIRRSGEYAADVAETVINHAVEGKT